MRGIALALSLLAAGPALAQAPAEVVEPLADGWTITFPARPQKSTEDGATTLMFQAGETAFIVNFSEMGFPLTGDAAVTRLREACDGMLEPLRKLAAEVKVHAMERCDRGAAYGFELRVTLTSPGTKPVRMRARVYLHLGRFYGAIYMAPRDGYSAEAAQAFLDSLGHPDLPPPPPPPPAKAPDTKR